MIKSTREVALFGWRDKHIEVLNAMLRNIVKMVVTHDGINNAIATAMQNAGEGDRVLESMVLLTNDQESSLLLDRIISDNTDAKYSINGDAGTTTVKAELIPNHDATPRLVCGVEEATKSTRQIIPTHELSITLTLHLEENVQHSGSIDKETATEDQLRDHIRATTTELSVQDSVDVYIGNNIETISNKVTSELNQHNATRPQGTGARVLIEASPNKFYTRRALAHRRKGLRMLCK
jgi:hypothetical protein